MYLKWKNFMFLISQYSLQKLSIILFENTRKSSMLRHFGYFFQNMKDEFSRKNQDLPFLKILKVLLFHAKK